jgi:hypothetical protein
LAVYIEYVDLGGKASPIHMAVWDYVS